MKIIMLLRKNLMALNIKILELFMIKKKLVQNLIYLRIVIPQ